MLNIDNKEYLCSLDYATDLIKAKWKTVIIYHLNKAPTRFLELQRTLPNISQKVLNEKLKELINDNIVEKEIFPEVPPRVEYRLTETGYELFKILRQLQSWGKNYISTYKS